MLKYYSTNVQEGIIPSTIPIFFLFCRLLPFLRCVALYVHFYTDVSLPERVGEEKETSPDKVYQALCTYLGLPLTLTDLMVSEGFSETVDM